MLLAGGVVRFHALPVDEVEPRSRCKVIRWGCGAALLGLLGACGLSLSRNPGIPRGNVEFLGVKQSIGIDLDDDFLPEPDPQDWSSLKKEIKLEKYDPGACLGKLSFATAWSASLGLKLRAAVQECNERNYRDDPTPFRRLHTLHRMPSLPQEASVYYPPSAWAEYDMASRGSRGRALEETNGPEAEAAYNLTSGFLRLKTRFAFGKQWTFEGWHYMKEHDSGCVWDTRSSSAAAGLRACFYGGLLRIDFFDPKNPNEAVPKVASVTAGGAIPLSTWIHLALQRRGSYLEFFMQGSPAGNATVPEQLTDGLLSQSNIRLGGSVDNNPGQNYKGMMSNMRLTTDAVYPHRFEPEANLQQLKKTRFLLKAHYIDVVTMRQMRMSGNVTTKYSPNILLDSWKAQGLIDDHNFTAPMNKTRLEVLRRLFPFEDPIYKTEFLGAFCARVILQILKEITTIQDKLMDAVPLCDPTATSPQCYKAVNYAVRQAVSVGRYGAELRPRCEQTVSEDFRGDFRCSERMEGISWALDGFGSQLSKAYRVCHDHDLSSPKLDYGACVGESLSATGYMFASALLLESALGFDCPSDFDDARPLTETLQLTCARDSTAIFRTTFLAGSKAVRAAGHCGGKDTLCGRSILRSAAAISGVAEVGVFQRVFCHGPTPCCQRNADTNELECACEKDDLIELRRDDRSDSQQCGRFSGSALKLLGSASLAATEAEGQCKFSKSAQSSCNTMVPAAMAGLGFFIENAARQSRDCPKPPFPLDPEERRKDKILGPADPQQFYQCGQDTKRLGVSMDVISRGIAGAVVNCPYGNADDLEQVTKPVKSARRFFTP
ncbi:unnamed protein product [Effrenium voratum]|uniref:Uncharacterized protein n=1 Tax=Effrenium voratum TaxID=2562239 RepID=A0AA36I675_9DINO|nr:unnamed protein product [Effrenium voratum]CAJ1452058.1 unnamed protein product [Effrenium voratum]